jgi:GT2 family glycosyltransferase
VSVVVVNWNGAADLPTCLAAVRAQTVAPSEVVVVDNNSTDGSPELAEREPGVRLLRMADNLGFGGAIDRAAAATTGDPLVVLNPDVELRPDWLAAVLAAFAADDGLGIVGGKLLYPDGKTIQHAGGIVRRPLMLADHRRYRQPDDQSEQGPIDVDYVTGAAFAIRRAAFDAIGGFDEGFFLYFEETDLCERARRAGWRVRYLPSAVAIHAESAVTGRESANYYRHYHYGRVRYALKHLTPAELLVDLVPAERARIGSIVSAEELAGVRHAYVENAARLEGGDPLLASAQPELHPALADALAALAERAIATIPTGLATGASSPLAQVAEVAPRPFSSGIPGVAAVRTAWNWMSTRWYLAPILEQQNRFNREAAEALARIEDRLARMEARQELQAGWLVELDHDLVALTRRVASTSTPPPPQGWSRSHPPADASHPCHPERSEGSVAGPDEGRILRSPRLPQDDMGGATPHDHAGAESRRDDADASR